MNTIGIYRKVVGNVRRITRKIMVQNEKFVSKPDIVDISKEAKSIKTDKFDIIMNNLASHLDRKVVRDLQKCSLDEFFKKSQKLIIDSYKIPSELAADIQFNPDLDSKIAMMYDFVQNIIWINPKIMKRSRLQLFSYLKHEYAHQKQNYQILCTEVLGEKAIQAYAKNLSENGAELFIKKFANISDKEFEVLKPQLGASSVWIEELREASKKGPDAINEFRTKITNNDYNVFFQNLSNLRENLIKEYGIIPLGTPKAKLSQEYFDGFMNNLENPSAIKVYLSTKHEQEACAAQTFSMFEFLLHKFI